MIQPEFPKCQFLRCITAAERAFLYLWLLKRSLTAKKASVFSRIQYLQNRYMRAHHSILNDFSVPACQSLIWYTINIVHTFFTGRIEESPNTYLVLTSVEHSAKLNPEFRKGSGRHSLCECIYLSHLINEISSALDLLKATVKM